MQSNYRRLGDYIKRVKEKNGDGLYDRLLGINIDKYFMPSVANVVGTDLSKYKVVKPSQFACNRMHVGRDYRLPIALSKEDKPFIVSPAYDVFEIKKPKELIAEYLMMWFSRAEFDRNTWFYTDTDVRGKLGWDSFCDMTLPVPSIEKQREIVKEYNTVTQRIQLNEQLNQKLEETAQALYKHWFVDFEFPEEEGRPYRSSGGAIGVGLDSLKGLIEIQDGKYTNSLEQLSNGLSLTDEKLGLSRKYMELYQEGTKQKFEMLSEQDRSILERLELYKAGSKQAFYELNSQGSRLLERLEFLRKDTRLNMDRLAFETRKELEEQMNSSLGRDLESMFEERERRIKMLELQNENKLQKKENAILTRQEVEAERKRRREEREREREQRRIEKENNERLAAERRAEKERQSHPVHFYSQFRNYRHWVEEGRPKPKK